MNIVFGLSGSIACFKACAVISELVKRGDSVQVVATKSALQFVGEATLEGLTAKPVLSDTFTRGHYMDHIHLERWSDLIICCPATANQINKFAAGLADDLLSTLFLAHEFNKPFLIAPAMNHAMLSHPTTQSSVNKLKQMGVNILGCGTGPLACQEQGTGRMLEPAQILSEIDHLTSPKPRLRVLITSGGTREPIDSVRSIANFSTGETGARLADHFAAHQVTYLHARDAKQPQRAVHKVAFQSFNDLNERLKELLGQEKFDVVIHAAAVSDYSVSSISADGDKLDTNAKLTSEHERLRLELTRNFKIIERLRSYASQPLVVIGFKLTHTHDLHQREAQVRKLSAPDFVVLNDLSEVSATHHHATIFARGERVAEVDGKSALGAILEQLTVHKLKEKS